ncbi:hypothetical protein [Jiangella mangrovi]|uniref:Uncharacterized protein n=1 Tax=Jiangella mangrovi TaxID=1524084 RepID=A0A7W9LM13_9ACTN|nr:hypothetical protein [Jiangella mangrovi]MBB5788756.1 hypothetical protein [Jiangella mangrovi]
MDRDTGQEEVRAEVGSLHLWVRYLGHEASGHGEPRARFQWRAEPTDVDVLDSLAGGPLYGPPGEAMSLRGALHAIASSLADAGERHAAGLPPAGRYPEWLGEIAHRNLIELRVLAVSTVAPPSVDLAADKPLPDLLSVEIAKQVLRRGDDIIAAGLLDADDLDHIHDLVLRAERDIVIRRDGDPFGKPLYQGPAADAHLHLEPGRYKAHGSLDPVGCVVIIGPSPFSEGGLASAAFDLQGARAQAGDRVAAHDGPRTPDTDRVTRMHSRPRGNVRPMSSPSVPPNGFVHPGSPEREM